MKGKEPYLGGALEFLNRRLYSIWGNLEEGIRTGEQQNGSVGDFFDTLYDEGEAGMIFLNGMAGVQFANFNILAQ